MRSQEKEEKGRMRTEEKKLDRGEKYREIGKIKNIQIGSEKR